MATQTEGRAARGACSGVSYAGPELDRIAHRFWTKVANSDPRTANSCWAWTAGVRTNGYGWFWFKGKRLGAHRVAWELEHGPIPDGLTLDHLCRNRACVNPAHLEAVTQGENIRRGVAARSQLHLTRP